jgi:hypothetical protein
LSPRARATFTKRQKEQARQERQRAKAERKLQRKREGQSGVPETNESELSQAEPGQDGPAVFGEQSNH